MSNTQREAKRQGRWLGNVWIPELPEPRGPEPAEPGPAKFIAASLALGIGEILEIIFLNLYMMQLLVSVSRVSRLWHVVVNDTPSLRRILHLDPSPAPLATPEPFHERNMNFTDKCSEPLIVKFFARGGERFTIPGASWRRMLVAHPPRAWVYCVWGKEPESGEEDTRTVARLDNLEAGGLRLGQVYDFMQSLRNNGRYKQCYEFFLYRDLDNRRPKWMSFANLVTKQLAVNIVGNDGIFIEAKDVTSNAAMSSHREPQTDPPRAQEPFPHPIFSIPEILEFIFLYLDMADLLVSVNRVSRLWHHVVNGPPSLRQILHFDPISMQGLSGPMEEDGTTPRPELVQNALLAANFGPRFFKSPRPPVAGMRWTPWDSGSSCSTPADVRQAFSRSGASWRRMLVSQPPPPRLSCVCNPLIYRIFCIQTRHVVQKTEMKSIDSAGLRMGQLYDFIQYRVPPSHSKNRLPLPIVYWNHIPDDEPDEADMARTLLKESGLIVFFFIATVFQTTTIGFVLSEPGRTH
ncbi:hypothetical protein F5X68DRAFT_261400 [Plectosphaerella plurivora]|uniref:F-box domain-containing protein n=1 Tax=Plectosphaerella plurivora TaxID=936078 RepID=A0A9P8VCF8_9PEZI|nr:hypothetical protein F5X68DRAFT_261400 [Plectosphaerella plurivora]